MMKLSVVVPIFNQEKDIVSFVEKLKKKIVQHTNVYDIILTTNQDFEYVEKLRSRLNDNFLVAVKESDDYQQVVMAGVDKADGDATIIITPSYDINIIDDMIEDWKNGKQVVCLRRKHNKFGKFLTKLRLRIYNLFLFLFGDIFSIGIFKDAQLLDKEIVDKMKEEQDMAHRFRTMYAPLDYNCSVHEIEHTIEKFETKKGSNHFDFWLGIVGAMTTFIAVITCIVLAIELAVPIWVWTLFIIFGLLFEFIFVALLVNATARVKIGILHYVDENGKIYNLTQEYYPTKPAVEEKPKTSRKRILNADIVEEKPKSTRKKTETKTADKVETKKQATTKTTRKKAEENKESKIEVKEDKIPLKTTIRKKTTDSKGNNSEATTKKTTTKKVEEPKEQEKVEIKKITPTKTAKSKENAEKTTVKSSTTAKKTEK